jgi:enoyl-CoA hydratase
MDYKTVVLTRDGKIASITLNRPEVLNAMNTQLNQELRAAINEVKNDKNIRVLIITGAGDKAFSAGRDLKEYSESKATPVEDWEKRIDQGGNFGLLGMPQPVIAAINGYAVGGGLELALACDIRIASEKATFGFFEIRRGFFPGGGATWRLAPLVGKGWAMELVLSGEPINRTVQHNKLRATVRELAEKIASKNPQAVMLAKAAINQSMEAYERIGFDISMALRALAETNTDIKQSTQAFLEKREA